MDRIAQAINERQVPQEQAAPQADPQAELQRIQGDDNTQATPQSNAMDIDILAANVSALIPVIQEMAERLVKIEQEHMMLLEQLAGGAVTEEVPLALEAPVEGGMEFPVAR